MIEIDIKKTLTGFESKMVLKVNIKIDDNQFLAVSGNSGSGKTTLLRVLAGLEEAEGYIKVDDTVWLDKKNSLQPQKREIGFVFQDYALFSNMSVKENLLYINDDRKLANELLEICEINELQGRYPSTLSGGQKQRVALCRAMMKRPKLLLMDEPLSALDPNMRVKLQEEIMAFHKRFETTTLFVSHDPSEIYKMANRVIVLEGGKIIKDGSPKEILLKTSGSQKLSFEGELLDLVKVDVIYIAIISIGQQIAEVVLSEGEIKGLKIGQKVRINSKAFSPTLS
jgi:molybdate transport system ATP-binding protein